MLRFRDKQVAANRSKFAERSTNPLEFSQYQMEQYLKASSLRQQLDMLRGVATTGAPIARPIAAVEGREYVLESLVTKDGPDHEDPNSNSAFVAKEREDREKPSSEVNQNLTLTFDVDIHEAEDEDVLWEDVDNECGGRETEANEKRVSRSRFWSLSHGFKMGRQLGKWGEEENLTGDKINDTEEDALEDQNEDIELAIAIKRSLEDAPKENVPGTEILQHHLDGTQKEHVVNHADQEPAMPPHNEKLDDQVALCDSDLSLKIDGHAVETCKPIQDDPNRITSEITPELPLLDNSSPKDDRPPCDDGVSAPKEAMAPRITVSVAQPSTFSPLSRISIGEKQKTLSSPRIPTVSEAEILNAEAPASDDVETKGKTVPMNLEEHYLDVGEKETNPAIINPDWVDETDSIQITHGEDEMRQERLEEEGVNAAQAAQWEEQHFIDDAVLSKDISSLLAEEGMLRSEHRAAAGQADTPTDTMYNECQQLLQLFGIPYIIAPSEAEAQAAWLDVNGLVDGVVTDDNDALLFGAKRLYRNIFENSKYVEEYRSEDIEMELGLSREKLVFLAMLLGSDYTPGVAGVGVVNAVEIVLAFEGLDGLKGFADWVTSVDEQLVSLVRPSLVGNSASGTEPGEETAIQKQFKSTHKNVRKNWTLPPAFPSKEVVDAYLLPKVDDSMDKFQFARPDADLLRHFCYEHLGWGHSRVDELLVPVLQNYDERQRQQTLDSFLSYRQRFAKIRSKRLQNAVAGIRKTELDAETVYSEEKEQKSKRKSHSIEGKKSNKKAKVQNKNK